MTISLPKKEKNTACKANDRHADCPSVLYPEKTLEKIKKIIEESEKEEKKPIFDSVEDMFSDMGIDTDPM